MRSHVSGTVAWALPGFVAFEPAAVWRKPRGVLHSMRSYCGHAILALGGQWAPEGKVGSGTARSACANSRGMAACMLPAVRTMPAGAALQRLAALAAYLPVCTNRL